MSFSGSSRILDYDAIYDETHSHRPGCVDIKMAVISRRYRRVRFFRGSDGGKSRQSYFAQIYINDLPSTILYSSADTLLSQVGARNHSKDPSEQTGNDDGPSLSAGLGTISSLFIGTNSTLGSSE